MKAGSVAIQQALVIYLGYSYREAAKFTGVNHRTIWQHVAANKGSNVAKWENRPESIQRAAIDAAIKLTLK